jgi:lipopolysaccharide biosynthesis glycosyltransferase
MRDASFPAAPGKKRIHVACCFDGRMAMPAGVLAASVAAATRDAHVTFYMLHSPDLPISIATLKQALDSDDFTIVDCVVSADRSSLSVNKQYSEAIYYRFFLPDFVKAERVIYLDTDMIVRRSLTELYDMDLGGAPVAATRDYALTCHMDDHEIPVVFKKTPMPVARYCAEILELDLSRVDYFNTGILVMDLEAIRQQRVIERCLEFCRTHSGLVMADQDAANHVLQGHFHRLDVRWNSFSYLYAEYFPGDRAPLPDIFGGFGKTLQAPPGLWRDILTQWATDPWVVHFAFESKPWRAGHRRTPYDAEFWLHAASTPFLEPLRDALLREERQQARIAWLKRFGLHPEAARLLLHDAFWGTVRASGLSKLRPRHRLRQLAQLVRGRK